MDNILGINKKDIENVLSLVKRQYFVGNLSRPQELPFISNSNIEIGITYYDKDTTEPPHYHPIQSEFGYILFGESNWTEVSTNITTTFKEGDFFSITPNTCYIQTSKANTKILFIKTPSTNDKQTCLNCPKNCTHKI